ncbi:CocE/NonD family hydrolase [bacterium]|nr:MAG: CocE/NonD family hydrolase [bacterium]
MVAPWLFLGANLREARTARLPHFVLQESELSQPTFTTSRLRNLRMRTRDGVTLVADAVRPQDLGRYPVILERTVSGREAALEKAAFWAARGYVYVAQDCRGRGDSGGSWLPFANGGRDGSDTITWVTRQPWCDGNVGMVGEGYAATAELLTAGERPAPLKCLVPRFAVGGLPFENGIFALRESLELIQNEDLSLGSKGLLTTPLSELDRDVLGRSSAVFQSWLRRGPSAEPPVSAPELPTLYVSGWADPNEIGTMNLWDAAVRRAGRTDQWLVYGPWANGSEIAAGTAGLEGLTLRFFDTYLKGRSVDLEKVRKVQAFVAVANRWEALGGWPAPSSTFETRYLAPSGIVSEAGDAGAAVYVYNPAKDVLQPETTTGKVKLPTKGTYALFVGAPTPQPTAIAGPFEVRLFFKSSAGDTDFFATLVDRAPDGSLWRIAQPGKIRASFRNEKTSEPLKPGRIYAATLRPWDAAFELKKGHRLGLLVQSSMFPRYARNEQAGPQRNVILTGRVTPSRITFRRLR